MPLYREREVPGIPDYREPVREPWGREELQLILDWLICRTRADTGLASPVSALLQLILDCIICRTRGDTGLTNPSQ